MRKLNPKPKEKRKVDIPYELQVGMFELFQSIQNAQHEQEEQFGFDDALQTDRLCGGKVGDGRRPYIFTFYPLRESDDASWHLPLHLTEIEDIADRVMTTITLYCCIDEACGFKTRNEKDHCSQCDYDD